jgi:hypothetical protein
VIRRRARIIAAVAGAASLAAATPTHARGPTGGTPLWLLEQNRRAAEHAHATAAPAPVAPRPQPTLPRPTAVPLD